MTKLPMSERVRLFDGFYRDHLLPALAAIDAALDYYAAAFEAALAGVAAPRITYAAAAGERSGPATVAIEYVAAGPVYRAR